MQVISCALTTVPRARPRAMAPPMLPEPMMVTFTVELSTFLLVLLLKFYSDSFNKASPFVEGLAQMYIKGVNRSGIPLR